MSQSRSVRLWRRWATRQESQAREACAATVAAQAALRCAPLDLGIQHAGTLALGAAVLAAQARAREALAVQLSAQLNTWSEARIVARQAERAAAREALRAHRRLSREQEREGPR